MSRIMLDFETAVPYGLYPNATIVNKFGRNTDIDTGTVPEDIWGGSGLYTGFPTTGSAETVSIVSDSANDTSAGTGARTFQIIGLDANYNIISETVSLNGTTPVLTTQTFWRVHTASVRTSGGTPTNSNFNVGSITVNHSTTTANVFMIVNPGANQSNNAGYTVPANKVGILKRVHGTVRGSATAHVDISLWIRQFGLAPRLRRPTAIDLGSGLDDSIWGGLFLPEKTDIHVRATISSANNLDIVAGYDLLILDKP